MSRILTCFPCSANKDACPSLSGAGRAFATKAGCSVFNCPCDQHIIILVVGLESADEINAAYNDFENKAKREEIVAFAQAEDIDSGI